MDENGLRTYFFRILGLSPGASHDEVIAACQKLLLERPSEERADEIYEAFRMITDETALREYIEKLGRLHSMQASLSSDPAQASLSLDPAQSLSLDPAQSLSLDPAQSLSLDPAQSLSSDPAQAPLSSDPKSAFDAIARAAERAALAAGNDLAGRGRSVRGNAPTVRVFFEYVYCCAIASAKREAEQVIGGEKELHHGLTRSSVRDLYAYAHQAGADAAERVSNAYGRELESMQSEDIIDELLRYIHRLFQFLSCSTNPPGSPDRMFRRDYEAMQE